MTNRLENLFTTRRMAQFSVHLAALALLGLVPVIFMSINHNHHPHVAWDLYGIACIWVAVFYASYYCTTDPTTGKQHAVTKFILQIILIATLAIAVMFLMRHFHDQAHRHDIPFHPFPEGSRDKNAPRAD